MRTNAFNKRVAPFAVFCAALGCPLEGAKVGSAASKAASSAFAAAQFAQAVFDQAGPFGDAQHFIAQQVGAVGRIDDALLQRGAFALELLHALLYAQQALVEGFRA